MIGTEQGDCAYDRADDRGGEWVNVTGTNPIMALSASEFLAAVLVGVGGEHDGVPSETQLDRALRLARKSSDRRYEAFMTRLAEVVDTEDSAASTEVDRPIPGSEVPTLPANSWVLACDETGTPFPYSVPMRVDGTWTATGWFRVLYRAGETG